MSRHRELSRAAIEAGCGALFAFGHPDVDPVKAWEMLGEEFKPHIRAQVRDVLVAAAAVDRKEKRS